MTHYIISDKFGHQLAELFCDGYLKGTNETMVYFYTIARPAIPLVAFWASLIDIRELEK